MKNAIEVKNLTKIYDGFKLNNISFQIPEGSVVGFIGENGAGKSTTIKALLGLIPVEEGQVNVLGHLIGEEADVSWREQLGVVFDECSFPGELKVKDIARFMKHIYRTWDEKQFENYMQKFELPTGKRVKELSKGMKMKLSIAVALSHDSRLLILDEATSGLDPVVRNEILDIFREYVEDEGHTVFLSSHITSDIEKIADYIILLHKGELLFMENKDKLIYDYGLVRCTREQADRIPTGIVVGREDNAYGTTVLVSDQNALKESGILESGMDGETAPAIDRAGIEDILLYIAKSKKEAV
ncbi:MAG: ABC transporter ATP-binding protein [Bacillota bacterium]|nr:ABC transporter ATP-binding protein [Bacillota bacterium]